MLHLRSVETVSYGEGRRNGTSQPMRPSHLTLRGRNHGDRARGVMNTMGSD